MVGDANTWHKVQAYDDGCGLWNTYKVFFYDQLEEAKDCARSLAGLDGCRVRVLSVEELVAFEVM